MELYIAIGIIIFIFLMFLISIFTARIRIKKTYEKLMAIGNEQGVTGAQVAVFANNKYNLNIRFARTEKDLADAYSAKEKLLIMSNRVCNTPSIASVAIVSHELGHAMQDKDKSKLLKLNHTLRIITSITNRLIFPLIIIGLFLYTFKVPTETFGLILVIIAGVLFLLEAILKLFTIPLEFNASKRAIKFLEENKILTNKEIAKSKRLLNTAGQTYILGLFDGINNALVKIKRTIFK